MELTVLFYAYFFLILFCPYLFRNLVLMITLKLLSFYLYLCISLNLLIVDMLAICDEVLDGDYDLTDARQSAR